MRDLLQKRMRGCEAFRQKMRERMSAGSSAARRRLDPVGRARLPAVGGRSALGPASRRALAVRARPSSAGRRVDGCHGGGAGRWCARAGAASERARSAPRPPLERGGTTGFASSVMPAAAHLGLRGVARVAGHDQRGRGGCRARARSRAIASMPDRAVGEAQVGDDQVDGAARAAPQRGERASRRRRRPPTRAPHDANSACIAATTAGSSSTTTTQRPASVRGAAAIAGAARSAAAPARARRRSARGTVTEKREPRPGVEASSTGWLEQRARAGARSRGRAPCRAAGVVARRRRRPGTNSSKIRSRSASAMPMPVSMTSMRTRRAAAARAEHDAARCACSGSRWRRGCAGCARAAPDRCRRARRVGTIAQRESVGGRLRREVGGEAREQRAERRRRARAGRSAPASSRDRSSSCANSASSASTDALDARDQRLHLGVARPGGERRGEQSHRVQRLAQVVARGGEKLALRAIRGLGGGARVERRPRLRLELADQVDVLVAHRERLRQHVVDAGGRTRARRRARRPARSAVNRCTWSPSSATRTISGTSAGSTKP